MAELKCPHCGQAFTVDDAELSSIVTLVFLQSTRRRYQHLKTRCSIMMSFCHVILSLHLLNDTLMKE